MWVRLFRGRLPRLFTNSFNSRTRVGATSYPSGAFSKFLVFNSRTRVGATNDPGKAERLKKVSIHAPVWVRPSCSIVSSSMSRFQFTHPCGCDHLSPCYFLPGLVSIHAPVWVRRPDEYGLSIKHATKVLRQPDARTRCGQA